MAMTMLPFFLRGESRHPAESSSREDADFTDHAMRPKNLRQAGVPLPCFAKMLSSMNLPYPLSLEGMARVLISK